MSNDQAAQETRTTSDQAGISASILDLFTVGIGPSSSHTVGPMRAAFGFASNLKDAGLLEQIARLEITLYGSLAATAHGHGTRKAILLGLSGYEVEKIDVNAINSILNTIQSQNRLSLAGVRDVPFRIEQDLILKARERLDFHVNGMAFSAFNHQGETVLSEQAFSIGGGFVVTEEEAARDQFDDADVELRFPFRTAAHLLDHCANTGLPIASIIDANEVAHRTAAETDKQLDHIWAVMQSCIERGCMTEGMMPGLNVPRRAAGLFKSLDASSKTSSLEEDPLAAIDWVNMWALAVNEENATGGRVVTAPTNGAAGIIPAVLHYHMRFGQNAKPEDARLFLKTAGAIGLLFKENASISGAEVGCQGEVGAACSMAAAGLAAVMGGCPKQVENAAEIGMEHNLGLTCDPVGGLVQVPCIERNAMGAVKAINAARLALKGDGDHFVSLDKVIRTMRITGRDMKTQYKETARGGLAVELQIAQTVVDC